MLRSLRGAGRLSLALGLGVAIGIGGAWVAARAEGPAQLKGPILLAAAKKKAKANKKGAGKSDMDMPKDDEAMDAASGSGKGTTPTPTATATADDKTLKFSRDIAPVLVGNCIGCHNPKSNDTKAAALDLTTFQGIMKGTEKRKVILAGKPDESPLILRVRGEEKRKMPPGAQQNLADETIERLEAWIKAGALLDGKDPTAPIKSYAQTPADALRAELAKLTPAQRDQRIEGVAHERWKKISPDATPETTLGTHFALYSMLPKDRATALVKLMDGQFDQVRKLLTPPGVPVLNGPLKISLYVFNDPNGFIELARTIENRDPEPNTVALANFGNETPYLAAVDPLAGRDEAPIVGKKPKAGKRASDDSTGGPERTLAGLLTEQLAAASLSAARDSKAPKYLILGLGAFYASRVEPRSPYYNHLRAESFTQFQLGWTEKAKEALSDTTDDEKLRAAGFSMLEWLAKQERGKFPRFVQGMMEGSEKLDTGLAELWQMKREDFLTAWGGWISGNYSHAR